MSKYSTSDAYQKFGIVSQLQALSECEISRALENYHSICENGKHTLSKNERVFGHLEHRWISDLVSHPAIIAKVREIIGDDILVWVSEFNTKPPESSGFFSWHQDLYYWGYKFPGNVKSIPITTAWLALTPANIGNGCMNVVPGSHDRLSHHIQTQDPHNLLTRGQNIEEQIDYGSSQFIELLAGEFSLHHPLLHHASGPNHSTESRIGLVIRYVSPAVVPPIRPAYAWLISGEDCGNNWDHVAPISHSTGGELRQKCVQSVQSFTGAGFK